MDIKKRSRILTAVLAVLIAGLYFYGNITLFILVYIGEFIFLTLRAIQISGRKRTRFALILSYAIILVIQIVYYVTVLADNIGWIHSPVKKLFAIIILIFPAVISQYVAVNKYTEFYLPSISEAATIGFHELRNILKKAKSVADKGSKAKGSITQDNIRKIAADLEKNDSLRYVNAGSLTDEYFNEAVKSLDDQHIYLVISDTGTPASEIISVFTQKQFNHASLSFDKDLKTIVSYNGGERVYPPGLNPELLSYFQKKHDARILIYRLAVTAEQKWKAIDKIRKINKEGSAYNMIGLLTGKSFKPNIMYCSQFVYSILEEIGAAPFKAQPGTIHPTDLIERDYFRKLEFVEMIKPEHQGTRTRTSKHKKHSEDKKKNHPEDMHKD